MDDNPYFTPNLYYTLITNESYRNPVPFTSRTDSDPCVVLRSVCRQGLPWFSLGAQTVAVASSQNKGPKGVWAPFPGPHRWTEPVDDGVSLPDRDVGARDTPRRSDRTPPEGTG